MVSLGGLQHLCRFLAELADDANGDFLALCRGERVADMAVSAGEMGQSWRVGRVTSCAPGLDRGRTAARTE